MSTEIEITVVDAEGRALVPGEESQKMVSSEMAIADLKHFLIKELLPADFPGIQRLGLTIKDPKGKAMSSNRKTIGDYAGDKSELTICYQDLGPQVSQLQFMVTAYSGPVILTSLFACYREQFYSTVEPKELTFNQQLGIGVVMFHYLRRLIESLCLHRLSDATMPWQAIPGIMVYYWLIFGCGVMYTFLTPAYEPWVADVSNEAYIGLTVLIVIFELLNLKCHQIKANLREPGTSTRGIPEGYGFGLVACANYMWEGLAWTVFIALAQTYGSVVFMFTSWFVMYGRGLENREKQMEYFADYPNKDQKILIPFLL